MPRPSNQEREARRVLELLYEQKSRAAARSIDDYLRSVVIDSAPEPRPYGEVREPWQKKRDETIGAAIAFVAGNNPGYSGPMNFWYGCHKAADKSSSLARYLNWTLCYAAKKNLRAYCGAKDAKQAAVILDMMVKEASLNPWFSKRLEFKRDKVECEANGARLEILTSDAAGVHGVNPDLVVCDELTNWASDDLFHALYSGSGKRAGHCAFVVLTNAGYLGSWQYQLREMAKAEHNRSWHFYESPLGTIVASWLNQAVLDQMRRMLSPTEARRLYDNEWIDLAEDHGAFRPEDIDCCVGQPLPPPPTATPVICVDYGQHQDPTALGVIWYDGEKVHVVELEAWQGSKDSPVQIEAVDAWLDSRLLKYPNAVVVFDKHQMVASLQRLEKRGVTVKAFGYRGGQQNRVMLETLQTILANHKIVFSDYAGFNNGDTLRDELKRIIVKRMSYGLRLDHDRHGHDDRTVVVGMAAMEAITLAPPPSVRQKQSSPVEQQRHKRPLVGGGFGDREHFRRWFGLN